MTRSILTALDELTRSTTAAFPRDEASALEAELRHIADAMRAATDNLQNDVTAVIESETAELERLLLLRHTPRAMRAAMNERGGAVARRDRTAPFGDKTSDRQLYEPKS